MKSPLYFLPALALAALPVRADVLLSNLNQPQRATTALNAQFWAAQSFTTDSAVHALQSIDALLSSSMRNPGTEFVAELHAEGGASGIGAQLTGFSFASAPTQTPTAIRLLPDQAVVLQPGQTYWLVIGEHFTSDDLEHLGWTYAEGNASTGPGRFGAFGFSTDGGASWSASSFDTPNPFQMAVNVSAVPEPAAWLLMPAGLALLMLRRRRTA